MRRPSSLLLPAVLALAAANFLWQLGSSSYFVDEVLSIQHALPSLGLVNHLVTRTETTPWTYFWGLHVWLHLTGSQSEWVTRLPEAVAGLALVGAVYWMARAFADRRTALLAALLTALSPLVLTYAQQVRVYIFVLLASSLAVGLAVRAVHEERGRTGRLVGLVASSVLALWLHYTALLIVAPLCLWLAFQRDLSVRSRVAVIGACAVGLLIELPLFLRQYHYSPNGGIGEGGGISALNVIRILGTPFDGRFVTQVNAFRLIAVVVLAAALVTVGLRGRGRIRQPRLLLALGLCAPLAILILGLAGKDVVITRYTVLAAPMLLTAVAASLTSLPRLAAGPLAALCLAATVWGLVRVHERTGFYPPARESIAYIGSHPYPGAVLALPGHPGADIPLGYYAQRLLHPLPAFIEATGPALGQALRRHQPVWLVVEQHSVTASPEALKRFLTTRVTSFGFHASRLRLATTSTTFVVTLFTPVPRHSPRR